MAYTTVEGRQQLLGALAEAIEIGLALASLSAAYERLDIATARTRSKKSCSARPSARTGARTGRMWSSPSGTGWPGGSRAAIGRGSLDRVKGFIDHAVAAVRAAGGTLATLQDSPMLLEVGDVELRKASRR